MPSRKLLKDIIYGHQTHHYTSDVVDCSKATHYRLNKHERDCLEGDVIGKSKLRC